MQQLSMEYKTKDYANNILQKFQFYAILISVQSKPMYNKGMYILIVDQCNSLTETI